MKSETKEWKVGSSIYRANPEWGARLWSWDLHLPQKKRSIIYWPEDWDKVSYDKVRGGNPILFPFASVCYDKGLAETWRHEGNALPMPRHGFARSGKFTTKEISANGFTATLNPTSQDQEAYPFQYQFSVQYLFDELEFKVIFALKNKDTKRIPWSAGHHFYFTLPWHSQAKREDYEIRLDYRKAAYYSPEGKLINDKAKDKEFSFNDPRIVDRIHYQLKHNRITFGPKSGEESTHIIIGSDEKPSAGKTLVTWTESENSPFYCVEPWMGPPNSQEHGKGLHWVDPNETDTFEVTVSLY